jgi:hypothetical protein
VEDLVKVILNPQSVLPVFFAVDLTRLPPVDVTHCDVSAILKELQALRSEVREITELRVEVMRLKELCSSISSKPETNESVLPRPTNSAAAADKPIFAHLAAQLQSTGISEPKKQMKKPVIGASSSSKIKAVDTKRNVELFVSRLSPDTMDEDILECVADALADHQNCNAMCERLPSKYVNLYCSYHVSVAVPASEMSDVINLLMSANSWPSGILVRRFFKPRSHLDEHKD